MTKNTPFFIVGCPRSGTTLLQLFLDSNRDVSIPPESHIFERYGKLFCSIHKNGPCTFPREIAQLLLTDAHVLQWKIQCKIEDLVHDNEQELEIPVIIDRLYRKFASSENKLIWGDKTPQHALCLNEITTLFPDAKIIHLIRDGRDVTESLNRVYIGPQSVKAIPNRWKHYINSVETFSKHNGNESVISVRYEDLVLNRDETLSKLCKFLNIEFEQQMLTEQSEDRKSFYLNMAPHFQQISTNLNKSRLQVYRKRFDEREIELIETICKKELLEYGYELETQADAFPTKWEELKFKYQDNIHRYLRKIFQPKAIKQTCREFWEAIQLKYRKAFHPVFQKKQ